LHFFAFLITQKRTKNKSKTKKEIFFMGFEDQEVAPALRLTTKKHLPKREGAI
jgi:hypothetical protein